MKTLNRKGTSMVEFSMLLPFFFVFIWLGVNFVIWGMQLNALHYAAKEGLKVAVESASTDTATVQDVVWKRVNTILGAYRPGYALGKNNVILTPQQETFDTNGKKSITPVIVTLHVNFSFTVAGHSFTTPEILVKATGFRCVRKDIES